MDVAPAIRSTNGVVPNGDASNASAPVATISRAERLAQPVELPRPPRFTAATLAGLAVAAGVGAIALGAWAFVSSMTFEDSNPGAGSGTTAEQILPLLAKPDTERIPLSGSDGRITLVVGAGGRGALVLDGLEAAAPGWTYEAWITQPGGGAPVSAGFFSGTEAVVSLAAPVQRGATVAVALEPAGGASAPDAPKLFARRRV